MVIYVVKNGYYRDTYNENLTAEWGMQISSGRQFHTSDSSWSELHVKRKGKYFVAHNNSSEWTPRKKEIFRSERGSYNNILIIMARHAPVNRSLSWADTLRILKLRFSIPRGWLQFKNWARKIQLQLRIVVRFSPSCWKWCLCIWVLPHGSEMFDTIAQASTKR